MHPVAFDPVDVHVGARLRALRAERGLTQSALGAKAGVTFQQVQKYECGANRVSASRLWALAGALEVDVAYFFAGLAAHERRIEAAAVPGDRQLLELAKVFRRIVRPSLRLEARRLVRALAEADAELQRLDAAAPARAAAE